MKTTLEWLSILPDGYRERATAQVANAWANDEVSSLPKALANMKVWGETNEGCHFWQAVCNHYCNGTPLPPLPVEPKSVSDWLSQLPAGYKERAVSQARHLSARVASMGEALVSVQPWNKTEEGESFWSKVYFHYATGAKLPSLPEPITVEDLESQLEEVTKSRDQWKGLAEECVKKLDELRSILK